MKCGKKCLLVEISLFCIMVFYTFNESKVLPNSINWLLLTGLMFGVGKLALSIRLVPLSNKQVWADLILLMFSVLLMVRFMFIGRDTRLIVAFITMFVVMDQEPEKIVRVLFFAKLLPFILVVVLGGYGHINGVALHGGMVILLFICMRGQKFNGKDFIVLLAAFLWLVMYTQSGSAVIGIGTAILSLILLGTRRGKRLFSSKFVMFIFPLALWFNVFFAVGLEERKVPWVGEHLPGFLNSGFFQIVKWIDDFTSHRLTLAAASFQKFGVSIWGGNVDYTQIWPGVYFNLDSGMIWLLQGWGLMICVVFLILSVVMMYYLIKTERYTFVVVAVAIALWATQEDMLTSVGTNFMMIFMGQAVQYSMVGRRGKDGNTENNSLLLVWRQ